MEANPTALFSTDTANSPFASEHARMLERLARASDRGAALPEPAFGSLADRYAPDVRDAAVRAWRDRMVNEHRSSAVFASLVPQFIEANTAIDAQTVVLRMALDEIHHAVLCGRIVRAFGAEPAREVDPALATMPAHPGVAPLERAMRNALFVGCLAETVAVALVTHERELAREPIVKATLDQILGDEVTHARFGWVFLAQALPALGDGGRARTEAYLRVALAYLERRELAELPAHAGASARLAGEAREQRECVGLCDGATAREVFYEAVETVILPRLEELGLGARKAWRERGEPPRA